MDLVNNLVLGFGIALHWQNILYCFVGVLLGTLIGVLPGIGPIATISMLLPATFVLPPVSALIMLAGIYYGAQYGGSTTAILVNLPVKCLRWSPASTATRWRARARRGRRWASRRWVRSSPAAWPRFSSPRSPRRSPSSR
jgi:TctA family transporter